MIDKRKFNLTSCVFCFFIPVSKMLQLLFKYVLVSFNCPFVFQVVFFCRAQMRLNRFWDLLAICAKFATIWCHRDVGKAPQTTLFSSRSSRLSTCCLQPTLETCQLWEGIAPPINHVFCLSEHSLCSLIWSFLLHVCLRRFALSSMDMEQRDYDSRAALHVAAAEGGVPGTHQTLQL